MNWLHSFSHRIPRVSFYCIDGYSVTVLHHDSSQKRWLHRDFAYSLPPFLILRPFLPIRTERKLRNSAVLEQALIFQPVLFLFCRKRHDRIKALLWEGDEFILLYKRLENRNFRWPYHENDIRPLSFQQFCWLMEGSKIKQKSSILPAEKDSFC